MSFDPFGDFEQRGYLRNFAGYKNPQLIKEDEHSAFLQNLPEAVENLRGRERITYQDVLDTHKILFEDVYPWAGQDRTTTAPQQRISKGDIEFALPGYEQKAVEFGLNLAQDQSAMAQKPGEVIGYLAYGHPFLDGNGRTILVVVNELAHRAGISIDWAGTDKDGYLTALTEEINEPHNGKLDAYLAPYVREAVSHEQTTQILSGLPGLGPEAEPGLIAKGEQPAGNAGAVVVKDAAEQERLAEVAKARRAAADYVAASFPGQTREEIQGQEPNAKEQDGDRDR